MSIEVRLLDARSIPRRASRRARAARAALDVARVALAGPDEWRRAARRTLLDVGRMLVVAFDPAGEAAFAAPSPPSMGSAPPRPAPERDAPRATGTDGWAAWM